MSETDAQHDHSRHAALKVAAPLIAFGATWVSRKALVLGYSAITGSEPPNPEDRRVTFARALTWTLATAATAAVVQMIIYRAFAPSDED
jgi:hypothetical protein